MRLHEWVARDKGYFDREGLDYELSEQLEKLIDREVPAASLFGGPYYFLEQLGLRKT
jgi:hypothetical protein